MRATAASLLLSGCDNYLFVERQFGPGDSERYRLGSVPWGREKVIEEDLCGAKQYAARWAWELVAARVLTQGQADDLVHNTCFTRANPHGPDRFTAQEALSKLAESLRPEQIGALNNALRALDASYSVERLSGMPPEAKLVAAFLGMVAVGTLSGLAASGAFSDSKGGGAGGSASRGAGGGPVGGGGP